MHDPVNFTVPQGDPADIYTACYFAITTHSTLGLGDVVPKSTLARGIVSLHLILVIAGSVGIYLFPVKRLEQIKFNK